MNSTIPNTLEFTRTFHPVGQGAFYSERFTFNENFAFLTIYDCGTDLLNRKLGTPNEILSGLESRIDQDLGPINSRTGKHDVQLLFLSHFDQDHVSGIHILNPRTVVIPLLTEEEITCLELLDFLQIIKVNWNLLRNPKQFFGNGTTVIGIAPDLEEGRLREPEGGIEINEEGWPRNIGRNEMYNSSPQSQNIDATIPSGTPIKLKNLWQYISFNPKISQLNEFKQALTAAGWNWDTLAHDLKTNLSKNKVKELHDIYKNISPTGKLDLNTTSLLVYSGPAGALLPFHQGNFKMKSTSCRYGSIHHHPYIYPLFRERIACMYFGDWMINSRKLQKYYQHSLLNTELIGTIQIPHHGSRYNKSHYALKLLDNPQRIISIISVGNINRHKHPSNKTVSDIMNLGSHVLYVTEDATSAFIANWQLTYRVGG